MILKINSCSELKSKVCFTHPDFLHLLPRQSYSVLRSLSPSLTTMLLLESWDDGLLTATQWAAVTTCLLLIKLPDNWRKYLQVRSVAFTCTMSSILINQLCHPGELPRRCVLSVDNVDLGVESLTTGARFLCLHTFTRLEWGVSWFWFV